MEQSTKDRYNILLHCIKACAISMQAPENIVDMTEEDYKELDILYRRMHDIQQKVACGRTKP